MVRPDIWNNGIGNGRLTCTGGVYMSSSCSPGTLCSLGTPWSHNLCKWQCTWANHVWHQEQTTTVYKHWQVMSNQGLQEWWSPTPHGSGVKAAFWLGVRLELWWTSYHLRLWWIQLVHTAVGWPPEMWKYTRNTIYKCKNIIYCNACILNQYIHCSTKASIPAIISAVWHEPGPLALMSVSSKASLPGENKGFCWVHRELLVSWSPA